MWNNNKSRLLSLFSLFLGINHFISCIHGDWRTCTAYSPPATVVFILFLLFEVRFSVLSHYSLLVSVQYHLFSTAGFALRSVHLDHVRDPGVRHLERRDGHRGAKEGGGAVGQEVPLEVDAGGVRTLLPLLVLALLQGGARGQAVRLPHIGLDWTWPQLLLLWFDFWCDIVTPMGVCIL